MKRMFLLAAAAAMTTVSLAGCSKGNTTTATNETQSTQAPTTTEAATPTTKKSSTGSSSPDTTGRRTTGSTGTTTRSGNSSTTLPGIPNTPGIPDVTDIPGVPKNVQKCVDISTAYLALFTPFVSGNGYDKQALDQAVATLDRIKGEVPANVASSLQTLEDGIKNIKSQGDMISFFSSPEFNQANEVVTKYVTVECQAAG